MGFTADPISRAGLQFGRRRAPRLLSTVLVLVALLLPAGRASADRGAELYRICASCHGPEGYGNMKLGAPAIAGLPQWYVEAQLQKFRQGIRGAHPEDFRGLQMRPMARALYTEQDVQIIATYVAGLAAAPVVTTLQGDALKGKASYTVCMTCHGDKAQGNEALKAPALAFQSDWYLVAQLTKFKQGIRGVHKGDVTGGQMRAMALTLADDQAMRDVVAYINSLGQK